MKYPSSNDTCFVIDTIDKVVDENFQVSRFKDPFEECIAESNDTKTENEYTRESVLQLEENPLFFRRHKFLDLKRTPSSRPKPSIEEPPTLELKPLPAYLKYAFLEKSDKLLVLISAFLTES